MSSDVLALALIVGACTFGFRYLPLRSALHDVDPDGALGRFLAATGPAAIATLLVAEALPFLRFDGGGLVPLLAGVAAVLMVFGALRSVVLATLAGSAAYGVAFAVVSG
jgi:branched-subunit amino acid transport protein